MDDIDKKILEMLSSRGRMSWTELAGVLGLSGPAAAERVRRLEERGIITGYTALVDPTAVGCELIAFVDVGLGRPARRDRLEEWVRSCHAVQECHSIAGDYDYRLKVWCSDVSELERLISEDLRPTLGLGRTRTTVVLSTSKNTQSIPFAGLERSVPTSTADTGQRAAAARKRVLKSAGRFGVQATLCSGYRKPD